MFLGPACLFCLLADVFGPCMLLHKTTQHVLQVLYSAEDRVNVLHILVLLW